MKKKLTLVAIIATSSLMYAGPACCGSGATKAASSSDSKKTAVASASTAASAETCSIADLSACFSSGKKLSTDQLKALVDAKADIVLVDARTAEWDDGRRIAKAHNLTPKSAEADVAGTLADKDAYIVTYCGGPKCPLSHNMAARLKGLGYTNVLVYPEGIDGWTMAGFEVN